ncbi:unnamed protein product [Paramecium pentaurelia]|uniref:Protein kinase domain-containing protein n=1 Tax=Paramecium pentaurelia TaxID=43138 RepID=A0A8S1SV42_9CILI|nr:unnamed protein product [Paramecium pentaurelia]
MKGWQNQYEITQKVNRNDDSYLQKIMYFENNEYRNTQQIIDHIDYKFHQSQCFSLHQLIESMNYNFTKIYKGQLIIIILEVLKHLQQLHKQKISHRKLIPQNIIIQLKNDNKLTIIQTKFTIQKVHFINYSIIDDSNYQFNYIEDINQIIDCFIQFIQAFSNQQCQLFKTICNILNDYKNIINEDDLNKLIDFFNLLIQDCVDLQQQKLNKGQIYLQIKLNESNIQEIKYQEGEEYGILTKRQRNQNVILKFIEQLNVQSITYELQYHNNNNNENNYVDQIQLFDTSQLSLDEFKIFNVFESIIKQQMMKIIWYHIGAYLESWESDFCKLIEAILQEINQTIEHILKTELITILKEFNNINQLNKQIEKEIETDYKFQIKYDEQKAKDQFILELKIQSQNYSKQNFQSFIDQIKSNIKIELENYYNQFVMIEILQLINDLI